MLTKRVERLLQLIQTLQSGRGFSADDLADAIGVSRRTIFRDLKVLSRAGMPFEFDRASRRYSAHRSALLPPVTLSHTEALSVLLATRAVTTGPLAWDRQAAASAAIKIESMLPPLVRDHCGTVLDKTDYRPAPASDATSIDTALTAIQTALVEQRAMSLRYDAPREGRVIDVMLSPYRLVFIHRAWYVIGHSREHKSARTYKVERIVQLCNGDVPYVPDPAFNLDEYFGHAWQMIRGDTRYHVAIRFSKKVSANVDEVIWHKSQRCTYEEDGCLLFEADIDGISEIAWWILGYGAEAEVIEPPVLRDQVAKHVRAMSHMYRPEVEANGQIG